MEVMRAGVGGAVMVGGNVSADLIRACRQEPPVEELSSMAKCMSDLSRSAVVGKASAKGLKGKNTAKAKAKGKSGAGGGGGKQASKATIQGVVQHVDQALALWKKFMAVDNLATLKAADPELKETEGRFKGKEDLLVSHAEDHLEAYRKAVRGVGALRALIKSWKAACHTCSEKNRLGFSHAFGSFVEVARDMESHTPDVCIAAGKDLLRLNVLSLCNAGKWQEAGDTLSTTQLSRQYSLSGKEAAAVQRLQGEELLKKMVRQNHEDVEQLTELWNSVMLKLGQTLDEEFSATLLHITQVANAAGRTPDDLRVSLDYLRQQKWQNSFVKTVLLVSHKLVEKATEILTEKHTQSAKRLHYEPTSMFLSHVFDSVHVSFLFIVRAA